MSRGPSTQMLRNLPLMTRQQLLDILDSQGFRCCYDFVYLPLSFANESSVGYAILNFTTLAHSERFTEECPQFSVWAALGAFYVEVASVQDSSHQGWEACVERFRNSPLMHRLVPDKFKPVIFADGLRVPFPEATAKIQLPKVPLDVRRRWKNTSGKADISSSHPSANSSDDDSVSDVASTTTVALQDVPVNLTRDVLLKVLDDEGFQGCYDFVYLPIAFESKRVVGSAIINFVSAEQVERFRQHFESFSGWPAPCPKVCAIHCVRDESHKGRMANIERYRNSSVMHSIVPDEFKPVVLFHGKRVPFPAPTSKVQAPVRVPRSVWREWSAMREQRRASLPHADKQDFGGVPAFESNNDEPKAFRLPFGLLPPPGLELPAGPIPPPELCPSNVGSSLLLQKTSPPRHQFSGLFADMDAEGLAGGSVNASNPRMPSQWSPAALATDGAEMHVLSALQSLRVTQQEAKLAKSEVDMRNILSSEADNSVVCAY